jgi:hypothetical protein
MTYVSYAQNMLNAHQQGVPLGAAAKAAIMQALGDAAMAPDKQTEGRRRAPPRKRANASAVRAGADQPSPPKRRRRAAPKRRQAGAGARAPASADAHKWAVPRAVSKQVVPNVVHQRSALAKRAVVSGYIRSGLAALGVIPFDSPPQCYRLATSTKGLSGGAGRAN